MSENQTTGEAQAIEHAARARWNAQADHWNQWDALGQDERDELIRREETQREPN